MYYTKVCKVCQVEKEIKEFAKQYNKPAFRCKECLSEYNKKYYKKNKKRLRARTAKYRKDHPEYMIEWRKNNQHLTSKQKREWVENNRDKINKNERRRRKKDHAYRVKKNLRRRVNEAITRPSIKCDSTFKLLGCSLEKFLEHLEKQFTKGMSWQNYGNKGWHIDHIKPCASFDLTDPEQQKICFHYTNLQPLWAEDNLRKSYKIL
jgi:hypothetical protein